MNWTNEELNKLLDECIAKMDKEDEGKLLWSLAKEADARKPKEEECRTCRRMKDVGHKCWWCGCK